MNQYHQALIPGESYHLFSRAVGNEKLFLLPGNYFYFLQKLKQHTADVCDFYCYSLLPNHFHLLARIKEELEIIQHFEEMKRIKFQPHQHDISDFIMERFSNFLNGYTKAFNKMNNRKGALFMDYLKRAKVNQEDDFTTFIWYLHKNAVHHGIANCMGEWPYDSYQSLLSHKPTSLLRNEVMEWFGGSEAFIQFHQQSIELKIQISESEF